MDPNAPPPLTSYGELAKSIDHAMLGPALTEAQVIEGCELARRYQVASVTVRPCDVDVVVRMLQGSGIAVGSVSGFPHGDQTTGTKLYETRDLLRRGAKEIDMVLNISKLLSRQFQHVEMEILQMTEACHKEGALLKVIFESGYLDDELKIVACRICNRAGVDFASTATGFGPLAAGSTDVLVMRKQLAEDIGLKAAGAVESLEQALEAHRLGCTRIGCTQTANVLEQWKARLQPAGAVS